MTMKIRMPHWWSLIKLCAAFFFLSALLNLDYPAERLFSWRLLLPSADVWLLLIVIAVAAGRGKRILYWAGLMICVLFPALRLIRIADTAVPMYLNRPFNLYIDSGYLIGLYDLIKTSSLQGNFLLMSATALTVALGAFASSCYALWAAARALSDTRIRVPFLWISALIFAAFWIWGLNAVKPPMTVRLGQEILSIYQQTAQRRAFVARLEKAAADRSANTAPLKGLHGADFLLFMIESYGRTVFSRPAYRQAMESTLDRFAGILERHGFTAVSSYLNSPTYGGSSWLAHGTLEYGTRVENDLQYPALLRSSLPCLASYFRESGYRTVSVMPGVRFAFPEGDWFGYEQVYYAHHFSYAGPTFGWAPMPDQFVLDWVRRRESMKRERPLFIRYVLISSHAAFNIQPPFIPDWDLIGDGRIYHNRQRVYFPVQWPDLKNAGDAYLRSLDYEFCVLGDYLAKYVRGDTLIVIMGDHQPNLQLTEVGEPWSVPVHVISRNPLLLAPFRKRGYTQGLAPDQPPPNAGMETFVHDFLKDFS